MRILITGGAGFIGCNTAQRFLKRSDEVIVFDNLSRAGSSLNVKWLREVGREFTFIKGDVRDYAEVQKVFELYDPIDTVFHFAAQVAVTTSVSNPREDFETNAFGTLNVLEACRNAGNKPTLLYSSTNKVYGALEDVEITEKPKRYEFKTLSHGVPETMPLDFYSPYGCSKGAADQYVRDYARIYELNTVVFRQSCIYGPRQFGVEDQGWVAWFMIAHLLGKPVTIYGNGRQVRDLLFVDDLVDAFIMAVEDIQKVKGKVYNIGGGRENTFSLLELVELLETYTGRTVDHSFDFRRLGDQPIFVCDLRKARQDFGWKPKTRMIDGVRELWEWLCRNRKIFR